MFFSIWNYHKCLSQLFPIILKTNFMSQRPVQCEWSTSDRLLFKSIPALYWSSPLGWHQFWFYFRTEVVYPTDHVIIFFRIFIFLQIFLINISMKPGETQTNYLYTWRTIECFHSTGPHADGIGPALGRQSVLQVCPPVSWLWNTNYPPISGDCSDLTVWYVGICWLVLFTWQYTTWKYNYFTLFRCFKIVFWLFRIFS